MNRPRIDASWAQASLGALKDARTALAARIGQVEEMLRDLEAADDRDHAVARERPPTRHSYRNTEDRAASH